MNVFGHLRLGQGLLPGLPLPAAVGGRCGAVRKGSFPLLGRLGLQTHGGRPFLSPPSGGMAFFFLLLFLVVLGGGGMSLGIFDVMFEAPL